MLKLKNAIAKYRAVPVATGLVAVAMPITAYASNLLSWMLDKPIILLSLAVFFVGAVVGVLARIYGSF